MKADFFRNNREKLLALLDDHSVCVILSGTLLRQSGDQYFPFEVDRNFFYLTGLNEPNLTLVMVKNGEESEHQLFLPPINERMERSNGAALRPERVTEISGITQVAYTSAQLQVSDYVGSAGGRLFTKVYFDYLPYPTWENPALISFISELKTVSPYVSIASANSLIHGLRFIKQEEEISAIRKAISLTWEGLSNALNHLGSGREEYLVRLDFEDPIKQKNHRVGFSSIVAAGINITTMHHSPGSAKCLEGEMLLFDVGAEHNFYSADISRTYPISGKFNERQRFLYEVVLKMQLECIAMMKPGALFKEVGDTARSVAIRELKQAGIITADDEVDKYYLHGVCHPLGLNVHDVRPLGEPGLALQKGVVCTIEPGLYFSEWGFGVRIEDDVLITEDGNEVLSTAIPKSVEDIERFMAR